MIIILFMKVIYLKSCNDILTGIKNLNLVLGFFDGVHVGHAQLISYARGVSQKDVLGVLTFDRPLKSVEGSLMDIDTKIEAMRRLNVDYLFIIVCDDNLKKMSYVTFVDDVLKKFNPKRIFCGPDFKFGYEAKGDVNYLKERFNNVTVLNYVKDHNGNKISSSNIKRLINEGDIKEANRYLGRPYQIDGSVIHGLNNGKILGFPTANLLPKTNYVIPPNGVYYTKTKINGITYRSITNIGTHPTIDKLLKPTIETFIMGETFNIYGENIELFFYLKARDEVKFNNIDELKEQIDKDIKNCEDFFNYKI